jgi:hypothetical protein
MTRSYLRSLSLCASALATVLCATGAAFAQESPPPLAAVPPPMQAMTAAKGTDDMTGSLGFGVGVAAGTSLIVPGTSVALKYWLSDVLAVSPALSFDMTKPSGAGTTTTWHFNPSAIVLFVPFRSTSTRFSVGGGVAIGIGKPVAGANTAVNFAIPLQAGVEHFFTRWFSMGIAARSNLIDYQKDVHFESTLDSTLLVGQLFFYTD